MLVFAVVTIILIVGAVAATIRGLITDGYRSRPVRTASTTEHLRNDQ